MHTRAKYDVVLALANEGVPKAEIARRVGIARATVRQWVNDPPAFLRGERASDGGCPMCAAVDRAQSVPQAYAYLLGLYLGDGVVSACPKGVFKLRIVLDRRYPGINAACCEAMITVMPRKVTRVNKEGCFEFASHSKHWPCVFPQHGAGRKHERAIVLEPWQQAIADEHPKELLKGLIHSDGCRVLNRVQGGAYAYPRYFFSNRSADIHAIFRRACDLLGIAWKQNNEYNTNVARRADVAFLDTFVGPKS